MNQQYKTNVRRWSRWMMGTMIVATSCLKAGAQNNPLASWEKGSNQISQVGIYGTVNTGSADNTPGARYGAATLTRTDGKMLLFGGQGSGPATAGGLNDIWQFDAATGFWTWIKGAAGVNQPAVYGTRGVADNLNTPGGRRTFAYTKDKQGRLWIFGGLGYGLTGTGSTYQNDLWRYDPASNQWTWIKGNNENGVFANYGTQGVAAATNSPGGRYGGLSWMDKDGKFWLFGGYGYTVSGGAGYLNDLWKYDPATDMWTWMKGSNVLSRPSTYGSLGVTDVANTPGGRYGGGNYWSDAAGNFYLFGGYGYSITIGYSNDLWKFDPVINEWTWLGGTQFSNELTKGVYGTKTVFGNGNIPGGRRYPMIWKDNADNIWLAGGYGYPASGTNEGALNDVWKYNAVTNQWAWMYYDSTLNTYGTYGTKGDVATTNKPGGRIGAAAWRDLQGNVWWFGGQGFGASTGSVFSNLNDLWKLQLNLPVFVDSVKVSTVNSVPAAIVAHGASLAVKATIYPTNASQAVTWSIVPVTGTATIDAHGVITPGSNGRIWAKAVSVASPIVKDSLLITISGQGIAGKPTPLLTPNPSNSYIYIRIPQLHPAFVITVYDAMGRLVYKTTSAANVFTQPQKLDISSFATGAYFLRFQGEGIDEVRQIGKY